MAKHARQPPPPADAKPTLAMTKFGVNTPCCDAVRAALESEYELLTFHATGLQPNVPHCCLRSDEGVRLSVGCTSTAHRTTRKLGTSVVTSHVTSGVIDETS